VDQLDVALRHFHQRFSRRQDFKFAVTLDGIARTGNQSGSE